MKRCPYCSKQIWDGATECNYCGAQWGMDNQQNDSIKVASYTHSHTASHLERTTQFQKYHNEKSGFGFAAEDANALQDTLAGKKVDKVGASNQLDGPDRIVNGVQIQTKYYDTPRGTVNSAFDKTTQQYRYAGQQLEVPADQYDACVELMKDRIRAGHVKDASGELVTNPNEATNIIRKGSVTFQQAKNIAKAGNIDSLVFDIKNNLVSTGYVGGISFLISFARYRWSGTDTTSALKCALSDAVQVGGIAMLTSVLSSQIMRTRTAAGLTALMRPGVKAIYSSTSLGKAAVEKLASAAAGKALSGAAAINSVSKLLRSNVVTSCISTAVITAPDFYRATISKNISWAQFGKNLTVNVAGIAGGAGGWAAGAAAGAAAGTIVPGIGNVVGGIIGGIVGAFGGGWLASSTTKAGLDAFVKDDAEEMLVLVQEAYEQLCFDYLLASDEVEKVSAKLPSLLSESWLRDMYGAGEGYRKKWAYNQLEPLFETTIKQRPHIALPHEEKMEEVLSDLLEGVEEASSRTQAKFCPNCGSNIPDSLNAKFCLECGAKLQQKNKCPECHRVMPHGAKFCSECGAKL